MDRSRPRLRPLDNYRTTLKGPPIANYDTFSRFYDPIMGDRALAAEYLQRFIRESHPKAKKVLELGCGTGSVLKHLRKNSYDVWGVDLSQKMLAIARRKVPQARLFHQDMVKLHLPEKFDVVCCIFDSINHVLNFAAWKKIFANAYRHLSPGGVFIFDINTQKRLDHHIAAPAWVYKFGNNLLVMTITAAPGNASNWNLKVFERVKGNRYRLHVENIREASFPAPTIVSALKQHFRKVKVADVERKRPSSRSDRLYFICWK